MHLTACNPELALPLLEEVVDARRRTLGDQHADTLTSINDLAVVHYQMGELAEAVTLQRETVAGYRRVLGEEHPQTRQTAENLRTASEALEASQPVPERSALGARRHSYESRPQARVVGIQSPNNNEGVEVLHSLVYSYTLYRL